MHTYVQIEMKMSISGNKKNSPPALTSVRQKQSEKSKSIFKFRHSFRYSFSGKFASLGPM